jgi:PTH1 family peptidyl-tRNA hydrolase
VDPLHSESPQIKLIAGLGNPGPDYRSTRHNLGFLVVDQLAHRHKIELSSSRAGHVAGRGTVGGRAVHLLKPQRYMNLSGPPVDAFLKNFRISHREILVIHDDIDLEFGRLKIKTKGGDGGHRGVRSLMDALETGEFARLRLGIGRSEADNDVVDHVLGQFDDREKAKLAAFIDLASDAAVTVLKSGLNQAMNRFNRKGSMQS